MIVQSFDLKRFIQAQEPVFETALAELRAGRKRGHWMWFVFPQLRGLGQSPMADRYGIGSRAEALAYAAHPVLGHRLRQCTAAVQTAGQPIDTVFGFPDTLKFRSCMTLFNAVLPAEAVYQTALRECCAGQADGRTLQLLRPGGLA